MFIRKATSCVGQMRKETEERVTEPLLKLDLDWAQKLTMQYCEVRKTCLSITHFFGSQVSKAIQPNFHSSSVLLIPAQI